MSLTFINIRVQRLFIFFIIILMARIRTDFVLLVHNCGCRCLSGTFVMVFCAARTQPGTNRGDPPLPATNRWMSEGGRLGNRISWPQSRRKNKPQNKKPRTLFNRSGSERDGRWAASICSETATFFFVCWSMCLSAARSRGDAPRQKRSAERPRTSAHLLSAVLLQPPPVMKQASTLLCPFGWLYFC